MKTKMLKALALVFAMILIVGTFTACDGGIVGPVGPQGDQGIQGEKGDKGDKGDQGIQGEKGDTGAIGNGIASVEKTSSNGLIDTFTITFTDGTTATFTVANGEKGVQGVQGEKGENGAQGPQGEKGKNGATIAKAEFDKEGNLVITLTDGTVLAPVEMPKAEMHVHTFGELLGFGNNEGVTCDKRMYYRVCSTCDYIQLSNGNKTDHTFGEEYRYDSTSHWKSCTTCGYYETQEEHIPSEENIDRCIICNAHIGYCYDGSETTIVFYHTMGANLREVLEKHIAKFNKMYPNITIEHRQIGTYDDVRDQIKTEIPVGNQPNIAYCYPDHVALYNLSDAVVTLDDFIASTETVTKADGTTDTLGLTDAQIANFIEGFYNEGRQFGDDKMYTLPMSKSTEVLYYNKTFFEEHNIDVPKTWNEFEEVCEQIKKIDDDCIPLGYDSESNWFITMCEQLGSDYTSATGDEHFLFDNEQNREFVARFRDWYDKGYVTTQELSGGYTSGLFTMDSSEAGNSYMSIGSSLGATHQRPKKDRDGKYPFEVGIATIPQENPDAPKVISQGPSLCIFNNENSQEVVASWLFVKYLTTTVEFQAEFSMASGYIPVIKSVADNETYKKNFLDLADGGEFITALSVKVGLEQKDAYYAIPAFYGSSVARDQVGLLMQRCMADKSVDIKKAFEDAVAECKSRSN